MKRLFPNALSETSVTRNPLTLSARLSSYWPLPKKRAKDEEEEEAPNFFGIPLDDSGFDESGAGLQTRTFQIVGVLSEIKEGAGQGGMRGMMQNAGIYVPLPMAHAWATEHRSPMSRVALALARQGGSLAAGQNEGYDSAVVRVTDPSNLPRYERRSLSWDSAASRLLTSSIRSELYF